MLPKAEHLPKLDIRAMNRAGWLTPGDAYTMAWDADDGIACGECTAEITVAADSLHMAYRHGGGRSRIVRQVFAIERATCNAHGGQRRYWHCPNCDGRAEILYGTWTGFYCRQCVGVSYLSQSKRPLRRLVLRLRRLVARIDGSSGAMFPPRPPGMQYRTYARLRAQYEEVNARYLDALSGRLASLRRQPAGRSARRVT